MSEGPNTPSDLDAAIARVVEAAGADAPAAPGRDRLARSVALTSTPRLRRWLPVAAAVIVGCGLLAGVVIATRGDEPSVRPGVSTGVAPPTTATAPVAPTTSIASATTTTPSSTPPAAVGMARPIVDPAVCVPLYARDGVAAGVSLFARPSSLPIAMQVIADPALGAAGPFALVQRYFDGERTPSGPESIEIGGVAYWTGVYDNGNGQVEWDIGDGSHGYLRSRGLGRDDLLAIVTALTPRATDAAVPGFDYTAPAPTLQLLHEQLNTDVNGEVHRSGCRNLTSGYQYRISAIDGDPVFRYGGVIDRPTPLDVGVINDTVLVIDGPADPNQPTTADIIDAAPDLWTDLTTRSEFASDLNPRYDIAVGETVTVELHSVVDGTPTSSLDVQVVESQGVASLQWDTSNTNLAPDAVLWKIDIEGRGSALRTAGIGGVSGHWIGDAPFTGEINVTISVVDGGDFTLQTTGPIQLVVT